MKASAQDLNPKAEKARLLAEIEAIHAQRDGASFTETEVRVMRAERLLLLLASGV